MSREMTALEVKSVEVSQMGWVRQRESKGGGGEVVKVVVARTSGEPRGSR